MAKKPSPPKGSLQKPMSQKRGERRLPQEVLDRLVSSRGSILPIEPRSDEISTGAVVPHDMRVRLVRSDSALLDIILTILLSLLLTATGAFFSYYFSVDTISAMEMFAMWILIILDVIFGIWLIGTKVANYKEGVTIDINRLCDTQRR